MSDAEALGYYIRKIREDAGLTQAELAAAVGMSRPTITQLERGQIKFPKITMMNAIAFACTIPPAALFEKAGVINSPAAGSAQLQWLATQLTTERVDLLVEIGHTMLREQGRQLARAPQSAARPSRSRP